MEVGLLFVYLLMVSLAKSEYIDAGEDEVYSHPYELNENIRPDNASLRAGVGFQPMNENHEWISPTDDEPLACNSFNEIYNNDEYIIQTRGYPNNAPGWTRCIWNFEVKSLVMVDIMCEKFQVPCVFKNRFFIYVDGSRETECTRPSEAIFTNQRFEIVRMSDPFNLNLEFRTRGRGTGIGFKCVVKGTGGATRPTDSTTTTMSTTTTSTTTTTTPRVDPDLYPTNCGKTIFNGLLRIVGGNTASKREYPFMVQVISGNSFCGGTLLNSRWVLTVAHCISGRSSTVRLGCHERNNCDLSVSVNSRVINAAYNPRRLTNDIAMLRMSQRVAFTNSIQPVCLPTQFANIPSSDWAAGWGKTSDRPGLSSILKEATLNLAADGTSCNIFGSFPSTVLCATAGSGSICNGDSGSFLGTQRNGRWQQDGITSFGAAASCSGYPMGFTEVRHYLAWIQRVYNAFPN